MSVCVCVTTPIKEAQASLNDQDPFLLFPIQTTITNTCTKKNLKTQQQHTRRQEHTHTHTHSSTHTHTHTTKTTTPHTHTHKHTYTQQKQQHHTHTHTHTGTEPHTTPLNTLKVSHAFGKYERDSRLPGKSRDICRDHYTGRTPPAAVICTNNALFRPATSTPKDSSE